MTFITRVPQENAGRDADTTPKCCCYLKILCKIVAQHQANPQATVMLNVFKSSSGMKSMNSHFVLLEIKV